MTVDTPAADTADRGSILIVDDDKGAAEVFDHCLRIHGYRVRVVASAEEAWRAVAADTPRAILLDLHLPGVDGIEWLRQLRAKDFPMPVALITGDYFVDEGAAQEIERLGATLYFKPIWEDELLKVVADLVTEH